MAIGATGTDWMAAPEWFCICGSCRICNRIHLANPSCRRKRTLLTASQRVRRDVMNRVSLNSDLTRLEYFLSSII